MQPQGQLQVLTNLIDFNMNPQEALDAPRWQWIKENEIEVESDMDEEIVQGLREKGHNIKVMEDFTNMGKGQIILKQLEEDDLSIMDNGKLQLSSKNEHGLAKNLDLSSYVCATEKRCDGHVAVW